MCSEKFPEQATGRWAGRRNQGHGHVYARPDSQKARCGGPGVCPECSRDAATKASDATRLFGPHWATDAGPRPVLSDISQGIERTTWDRLIFGESDLALCGWSKTGNFHVWGTVEQIAEIAFRGATK